MECRGKLRNKQHICDHLSKVLGRCVLRCAPRVLTRHAQTPFKSDRGEVFHGTFCCSEGVWVHGRNMTVMLYLCL